MQSSTDVVIVGAGAAGLKAAADLVEAGKTVRVLEARDRIGGRIWTQREARAGVPIELGAELIHGRPKPTFDLLERAGSKPLPIDGRHEGVELEDVLGVVVQAPQFRPPAGYRAALAVLEHCFDRASAELDLCSVVREIAWSPGKVELTGERLGQRFDCFAARAIVSVPLGVLKQGSLRFVPAVDKEQALAALDAGPVHKLVLVFAKPFWWQTDHGRHRGSAFFHAPDAPIPTFWTSLPALAPVLVAWVGGPPAAALAGASRATLVDLALESLVAIFGAGAKPRELLVSAHFHDWQADPFSLGAYSNLRAGGADSARELGRPIENTLFFAGEATSEHEDIGTVAAALESGARAARELIQSC